MRMRKVLLGSTEGSGLAAPEGEGEDDVGHGPGQAVNCSHRRRCQQDSQHPYRVGESLGICSSSSSITIPRGSSPSLPPA